MLQLHVDEHSLCQTHVLTATEWGINNVALLVFPCMRQDLLGAQAREGTSTSEVNDPHYRTQKSAVASALMAFVSLKLCHRCAAERLSSSAVVASDGNASLIRPATIVSSDHP
jgi:hypothetical protein